MELRTNSVRINRVQPLFPNISITTKCDPHIPWFPILNLLMSIGANKDNNSNYMEVSSYELCQNCQLSMIAKNSNVKIYTNNIFYILNFVFFIFYTTDSQKPDKLSIDGSFFFFNYHKIREMRILALM